MNQRIKHPDTKNALSLVHAAEKEMQFTLKQAVTEESAFNLIRNIYECFRMLGDAKLIAKGIVSKDHIEPINELISMQIKTQRPLQLINSLRKLRHDINYYGYVPSKEEAQDAVSIAHACFEQLLQEIKNEIER